MKMNKFEAGLYLFGISQLLIVILAAGLIYMGH
jgi:hypothetical protein